MLFCFGLRAAARLPSIVVLEMLVMSLPDMAVSDL